MNQNNIHAWCNDNTDIISDFDAIYYKKYRELSDKYPREYHNTIRRQCYDECLTKIIDEMSFSLALSYDECYDVLEGYIKIW